mmetsp:Transcript_9404/g.40782  ORF Transcript_9404/g.40782 Transcript_9404/m.40782 type:complete len:247 (-) Transcript_9404:58-798(-)
MKREISGKPLSRMSPKPHLNPRVHTLLVAQCSDLCDLLNLAIDEALSAKARVDAHDKDQVNILDHVLNRRHGSRWVQHNTSLAAQTLDQVYSAVKMDCGFTLAMNGDDISSSLNEVRNSEFRLHNHKMHIQRLVSDGPQGIDDQGSNRDVWYESSVHDIDMDPVTSGLIDRSNFLSKLREVCGQNRRRNHAISFLRRAHSVAHPRSNGASPSTGAHRRSNTTNKRHLSFFDSSILNFPNSPLVFPA